MNPRKSSLSPFSISVMHSGRAIVEASGLMFYGVNNLDLDRRAATYVDRILKGRHPT